MNDIVGMSRERIEKGSKSFAATARLLPPGMRDDAYMLYAWCRHCDDVIDGQDLGHGASAPDPASVRAALADLERDTMAAIEGRATNPVFIALSRVVASHRIPRRHPLDLIEGFRMDVAGRRYETLDDTLSYCYHVAGVVGVMMAYVMGVKDGPTLQRAQDLGIAFQITNICRDIVEDAGQGRVYIPAAWLADVGLTTAGVGDLENRDRIAVVARRLLDVADRYYASAAVGLGALPFRAAWAIAAAGRVYGEIGDLVREREARAWDARAFVPRNRKLVAIATALGSAMRSRGPALLQPATPRDVTLWTKDNLAGE